MVEEVKPQSKSFDYYLRTAGGGSNPEIPPYNLLLGSSTSNYTWEDRRSGGDLRNYKDFIKKGANATNPYSGTRSKCNASPEVAYLRGDVKYVIHNPPFEPVFIDYWYQDTRRGWFLVGGPDASLNTPSTKAVNQSYTAFLNKATAVQRQFMSGVFLGELRESLHMIRHPAQALRRGIDGYFDTLKKRRRRTSPKHKPRVLRDTWLEYSFGWSPLINDIKNARNALENSAFAHEKSQRVTGAGFDENHVGLGPGTGNYGMRYTSEMTEKIRCLTYGAVRTSPDPTTRQLRNVGISLNDFVPTIWELIPYSFLVDYFSNIGDVLSAWSFRYSDVAWAGRSIKTETQSRSSPNGIEPPPSQYERFGGSHGSCQWLTERIARTPLQPHDIMPSLAFEVPGVGSLKWLNLAALARTHRSLTPY